MLKRISIALLALSSINVQAQLTSYQSIIDAITKEGHGIRVGLDVKKCQTDYPISVDAYGYIVPDAVMAIKDKYITFSMLHFTVNEPRFVGKPVYESSKYRLTPDGTLTQDSQVLDAKSFESLGTESHMTCSLNEGVKFFITN